MKTNGLFHDAIDKENENRINPYEECGAKYNIECNYIIPLPMTLVNSMTNNVLDGSEAVSYTHLTLPTTERV